MWDTSNYFWLASGVRAGLFLLLQGFPDIASILCSPVVINNLACGFHWTWYVWTAATISDLRLQMKLSPSLLRVSPLTADILPGQEEFWQSFDISQPAWYWSTFLMWSRRQKSSSTSPAKRTSPISGFFAEGPDICWSLGLRIQRCSGQSLKKQDLWTLFCYTNVSNRRNPRGLIWRCTLIESEPQIFKYCSEPLFCWFSPSFFGGGGFEFLPDRNGKGAETDKGWDCSALKLPVYVN